MSDFLSFQLTDDFIEPYSALKPDWGFSIGGGNYLSEIIYVSKYSALKEDGTKEQWYETCRRCVEGMYSILKDHCKKNKTPWNDLKAQKSARDAYDRMFHFKWTPPGRGLQHMGREAIHTRQDSSFLQNCFSGDQTFLTDEGVRSFVDSVGESFKIVIEDGLWAEGHVSSFGTQPLSRIVFKPSGIRSGIRREVRATPSHRWILANGDETTTLKVNDVVKGSLTKPEFNDDYYDGLLHGVIYGDGNKTSHTYQDGRNGFELRACDSRTHDLAMMPELKVKWDKIYTERASGNGDHFFFLKSHKDLKSLPIDPNPSYAKGFLEGWIAADASISRTGSYRLDSQNTQSKVWLESYAALAGYSLIGFSIESSATNFGERKNPLLRFTLSETIYDWKVVEVEDLEIEEEVFCLTVPDTGAFTLANGIYTGNCGYLTTAKLSAHSAWEATGPFTRMMEMSMCGIGIGFDTRGAGNLTIHQPVAEKSESFIVPDSREGWADAIGALLESYFFKNRGRVSFDYTEIRPAGAPLKSFGGRASGPQPLIDCIDRIQYLLDDREDQKITSRDITDIMNLIGKAVVAGGARRSAQIAFGSVDDDDYTSIKDWNLPENKLRTDSDEGWAWNSNNSVFVEGEIPTSLIDKTVLNGEPGYMWLDLAQQYGRMVDPRNDKDYRAMGGNPCLEQTLEPYECCTLVECYPTKHDDYDDFRQTLKAAYLYGKAVTLLPTAWPETNEVMARNRRIGTSMSGLALFVETRGWSELQKWMDEGYQFIQHRDMKYSEWLAVRESIKTTSVKPSGTVSLVTSVTPGVHWPVSAGSHIRRVRYSVNDPLLAKLEEAGYPSEPMHGDPKNTAVVTFVTQAPNIRDERSVSIWEKTELAVMAQRWWADNQVSATITFLPEEKDQIAPLLASKKGQIKGISFLPLEDGEVYAQAPYERIAEDKAQEMLAGVKKLKGLYKKGQEAIGDKFCDNDVCTI